MVRGADRRRPDGTPVIRPILGVLGLAIAAVETRGRLRGRYWSWRLQTAYGKARPPTRGRQITDALEYGRWRLRMGRYR